VRNLDRPVKRAQGLLAQAALGALLFLVLPARALTADHYELALRPAYDAQVLAGHARIRLKADADPSSVLDLASPNLQIASVIVDGRARPFEKTPTGWRVALGDMSAQASSPTWLELDYRAPAAEGLVFGNQHVYTAFNTCQWLPCVGPDLTRATVAITLDLPPGQRSVASGGPRPYPLYTLGFAAGRFTEFIDPIDARLRYLGAADDIAALHAKFKDTARVLNFLEDKAGVSLPPAVYTQVLVPGAAAQEASSFSVIGKSMLDPILDDPQEDWVIAHEMAHQWWGNLVTCATWSEFWLNEGIAVFMTAAWKQQRWGDTAYRNELALLDKRWQRAKDAGFDKPLSWTGEYPSLGIRRSIQYSKGALFMQALREDIGERAFWNGLRRYTQDNAGRGVRSADLQIAMERSAGRSLKLLFDRWVY
jgi:aminopeptidase N